MTVFLCRMAGQLPSAEVWSCGLHVSSAGNIDSAMDSWALYTNYLWNTRVAFTKHFATTVTLASQTVYELDQASGKAVDKRERVAAGAGTSANLCLPQEVAEVVSLRTAAPGPAGRGRMFLPPVTVAAVTNQARIDPAVTQDLRAEVYELLSQLGSTAHAPILYSKGRANRPITQVEVGDVFDAMRSRRDSLKEILATGDPLPLAQGLVLGPRGTSL